jgi:polyisoprenyl-teichoic acid--peptidoglycan teichoic acid transferase
MGALGSNQGPFSGRQGNPGGAAGRKGGGAPHRNGSGAPQVLWSGLLLGSLLMIFVATFVYVAYLFVGWGRAAAAKAPEMPPLALPRLVQAAAASGSVESASAGMLFPTSNRKPEEAAPALQDRITVLLLGVDNRPGQAVARTDTIMILTIDPKTGSAGMLSLPRDLLVSVPALNDSVKINTIHVIGEIRNYPGGGPAMLRDTVTDLLGYPIDYYVRVNFDGFRQIIDLIGGVDIQVARDIRDDKFPDENYGYDPLYIPAGLQHMDGALALKYARVRHIDTDYQRAGRQQQVIMAVKDKITQSGQLAALLPRLPGLALAMANSVQTDMPVEKAIMLARAVGQMDLANPTRAVVDNSMGKAALDPVKGYILVPDLDKVKAAAAAVFGQTPGAPAVSSAETTRQAIQAEAARVVVLNGTTESGLGTEIAANLTAEGFQVVAVGNADGADYQQTMLISNGDGHDVTREALVSRFGIAPDRVRSELPSDSVDLTLIVGADQVIAEAAQ